MLFVISGVFKEACPYVTLDERRGNEYEPEQDSRIRELADIIFPRIAEEMRGAAEELGRPDSPMHGWGSLREKSPAELQELGMSLSESDAFAAFSARLEAVQRIVDSAVEEWGSQREMPAEEVRQIQDQALRMTAPMLYQMFGIDMPGSCEIPHTGRRQDS
jgi:hypothetical protein